MINYPRLNTALRIDILKMIYAANHGHPGNAFSNIDLLSVLYFGEFLKCNPKKPEWSGRDYLIFGEKDSIASLYVILGEIGFFSKDEYFFFKQTEGILNGTPEIDIPGIEIPCYKQALSIASGIALGVKLDKKKNRVFCMIGEDELHTDEVWEAVEYISKEKLDNTTLILNKTSDAPSDDTMIRFQSFGWNTIYLKNGHDYTQIQKSYDKALKTKEKPTLILANTILGKGISFMENKKEPMNRILTDKEFEKGMEELEKEF